MPFREKFPSNPFRSASWHPDGRAGRPLTIAASIVLVVAAGIGLNRWWGGHEAAQAAPPVIVAEASSPPLIRAEPPAEPAQQPPPTPSESESKPAAVVPPSPPEPPAEPAQPPPPLPEPKPVAVVPPSPPEPPADRRPDPVPPKPPEVVRPRIVGSLAVAGPKARLMGEIADLVLDGKVEKVEGGNAVMAWRATSAVGRETIEGRTPWPATRPSLAELSAIFRDKADRAPWAVELRLGVEGEEPAEAWASSRSALISVGFPKVKGLTYPLAEEPDRRDANGIWYAIARREFDRMRVAVTFDPRQERWVFVDTTPCRVDSYHDRFLPDAFPYLEAASRGLRVPTWLPMAEPRDADRAADPVTPTTSNRIASMLGVGPYPGSPNPSVDLRIYRGYPTPALSERIPIVVKPSLLPGGTTDSLPVLVSPVEADAYARSVDANSGGAGWKVFDPAGLAERLAPRPQSGRRAEPSGWVVDDPSNASGMLFAPGQGLAELGPIVEGRSNSYRWDDPALSSAIDPFHRGVNNVFRLRLILPGDRTR